MHIVESEKGSNFFAPFPTKEKTTAARSEARTARRAEKSGGFRERSADFTCKRGAGAHYGTTANSTRGYGEIPPPLNTGSAKYVPGVTSTRVALYT